MIFRQLFDSVSSTYSYLLASRQGGEALIIDPVLEKVDRYLQLVAELDLKLVKAVDTHIHADHITGLGALRDRTHCITVMGENAKVDVVSMRVSEGDKLTIEGLALDVLYTPGHTDDSYSFLTRDRVFTGDTLLIRGTGRTDFQNGSARAQYESLFGKLLKLPEDTLVFPAHDYKGDTVSTIGEEKRCNPRLQENIRPGGMLHELATATAKRIVFYCAFGERSAMAVQAAQDAGIASACHIHGGLDAWRKANGPLVR